MKLQYLNYKLPLKPVENGHGYMGTLGQTEDGELVQCHICGDLVKNLGHHAFFKHEMKAKEYREKFQLGKRTALCSDLFSKERKERGLKNWAKLSEEEKRSRIETMHKHTDRSKGNPRTLEALNKDGMCPDQLLERIQEVADKVGHSPTHQEFIKHYKGKYVGAINRTFGSWNGAKRILKLHPCKPGSEIPHNRSKYTNDQLIGYLRSFYKEKKEIPTHADCKRGFLPSWYLYQHRFGGMKKARQLAGIPQK